MAACQSCLNLDKIPSSTEPHENLRLNGSRKHKSMGNASGNVESYSCQICGSRLIRDNDRKDPGAIWEITP